MIDISRRRLPYVLMDVFTERPLEGNQLAIFTDARGLSAEQMQELAREGHYPSGSYLPALARGFASFAREDFSAAIEALAPLAGQNERIGGSRAGIWGHGPATARRAAAASI